MFERWLIKVTLGHLAAGHSRTGRLYPAVPEIVAALFGLIPMAPPIGMHSMVGVSRHTDVVQEVLFRELTAVDPSGRERVLGSFVAVHSLPFLMSFGGPFPVEDYFVTPNGASYLDPYDCTHARASFHPPFVRLYDHPSKELIARFQWT